jgi:trans-aconitate methyltransferase
MSDTPAEHWNSIYATKEPRSLSWYQERPDTSLRLLNSFCDTETPVIDIGSGASTLADDLLQGGWRDITILDLSTEVMNIARTRLASTPVELITADVLTWVPSRNFGAWHDRAVFHFLTAPDEQEQYIKVLVSALASRGYALIATFADNGPEQCSGLPTARYSPSELAKRFSQSFDLVHAEREEHHTPHGAVQNFSWVVLQKK